MTRREAGRSRRGAARGRRRAAGAGGGGGGGGGGRQPQRAAAEQRELGLALGAQLQGETNHFAIKTFPFFKCSTFPHHYFLIPKEYRFAIFIIRQIPHAQHPPHVAKCSRGVLVRRGGSTASAFYFHLFSFFISTSSFSTLSSHCKNKLPRQAVFSGEDIKGVAKCSRGVLVRRGGSTASAFYFNLALSLSSSPFQTVVAKRQIWWAVISRD